MTPLLTVPLFVVSLAVTLGAAGFFARRLDRVGARLGLPEAVLGLLTALAADGPEITSALVALAKGAGAVSLGVLIGSNIFNLAAMIGLSALLAGRVRLRREALVLEGGVGLLVTRARLGARDRLSVAGRRGRRADVRARAVRGVAAARLVVRAAHRARQPRRGRARAGGAGPRSHEPRCARGAALAPRGPDPARSRADRARQHGDGRVRAVSVGPLARLADLVGVLVLGPLTSLPNAFTAVRLGLARRGAALVSETTNSNTINLFAGIVLPALFVGVARATAGVKLELAWLLAMTAFTLVVLARRRGMGRLAGAVLVVFYVVFVLVELVAR